MKQDDRTDAQKLTHTIAVVDTDRVLSGWGKAEGMPSYAAWSFDGAITHGARVFAWVSRRSDMQRIRMVSLKGYRPKQPSHLHVYVVGEDHPAAGR
jgi:hypothetical protein